MNVTVKLSEAEARALAGSVPSPELASAKNRLYAAIERAERVEAEEAEARVRNEARLATRVSTREAFESRADALRLGKTQREVLRSLVRASYPGGWVWDNHSGTVRRLESLVRKGLASKVEMTDRFGHKRARYSATDAAREVVGAYVR